MRKTLAVLLALLVLVACKPEGGGGSGDKPPRITQWVGASKKICGVPTDPPDLGTNPLFPKAKWWQVIVVVMVDEYRLDHRGKRRCRDPNMSLPFMFTLSGMVDGNPGTKGDGTPLPWTASLLTPHYEHLYVGRGARSWHVKATASYVLPQDADPTPLRYLRMAIWVDGHRIDWQSEPTANRARVECLHIHG